MNQPALVPWPAQARFDRAVWPLPRKLRIQCDDGFEAEADLLAIDLKIHCSVGSVFSDSSPHIQLRQTNCPKHPESYTLSITPTGVTLEAGTAAGLYRGTRTLIQWLASAQNGNVRCGQVEDSPRCDWRGLMLDVSRHFFTAQEVMRFIDRAAFHKFNIFHWHLTDDQGWRFPVTKYPELTEVGAWREETLLGHLQNRPFQFDGKRHGGAYTASEIRQVVAYATARHVTVVPEIDMPGHMQAAITAYPHLGSGFSPGVRCHWGISQNILHPSVQSMRFIHDVLDEVMNFFPGPFVHTGGDEADHHEWGESRPVQRFMRKHGVANPKALQAWFTQEVAAYLRKGGRRMIGWDEVQEMSQVSNIPLSQEVVVMNWRDCKHGRDALKQGHDVILTPTTFTYFDFYQHNPAKEPLAIGGFLPLKKVYSFLPELSAAKRTPGRILGAQAQLWTEYIPTFDHLLRMTWPRAGALAEVLWTPPQHHSWKRFLRNAIPSGKCHSSSGK